MLYNPQPNSYSCVLLTVVLIVVLTSMWRLLCCVHLRCVDCYSDINLTVASDIHKPRAQTIISWECVMDRMNATTPLKR